MVDQTNQLVIATSIDQAKRETTLLRPVSVFINLAMQAHSANPSAPFVSAFLVTNVLESQRHPELSCTENDAVRLSRDFLSWAVKDAIECGELASYIDAYPLTETLLVVLCGVGAVCRLFAQP